MEYVFEERIGNPELFTGRKEELAFFLRWIGNIKEEKSKSTAILSRRKMGKTALLERLFNITFAANDGVIPFYYEVQYTPVWVVDFCRDFFLTFIYQYMAFKTRKKEYLTATNKTNLDIVLQLVEKEGLSHLSGYIQGIKNAIEQDSIDILWLLTRNAPRNIAAHQGEYIVQMIDEFQFINAMVYYDKGKANRASRLTGGYMSTAESKVAPLLVSGSWVGWLMNELIMLLPARFKMRFFPNMPETEAVEMVFKYSDFYEVPVTEETAYQIARIAEGNPFYISALMCSNDREKDLTTTQGLARTLEFEILNHEGEIKSTWMEYIGYAFRKANQKNAKTIVLYLCKHRQRPVTCKELLEKVVPDMTDADLGAKMNALFRADLIDKGRSNSEYQGVQDNIFDKVFRGVYEQEIVDFDPALIGQEIRQSFDALKKQYHQLQGKYNYQKGYFAEYVILTLLKNRAYQLNESLKSVTRHLPVDFDFCEYRRVWRYDGSLEYGQNFNVDIYALPKAAGDYAIIGEVKNRSTQAFSKEEVLAFMAKYNELKTREQVERVIPFIFSLPGFTREAEEYCQTMGIACSHDERWLNN